METPYFHASTRIIASKIFALEDKDGKKVMSPLHMSILGIIGRYPAENGCFLSMAQLQNKIAGRQPTMKTLRRHMSFLEYVGAIKTSEEKGKIVRRLSEPVEMVCLSTRDFRVLRLKMPEYRHLKGYIAPIRDQSNLIELTPVFFGNTEANFATPEGKVCQTHDDLFLGQARANFAQEKAKFALNDNQKDRANFAPLEGKVCQVERQSLPVNTNSSIEVRSFNEELKKDTPPKPPSGFSNDPPPDQVGGGGEVVENNESDTSWSEPLTGMPRKKTPRTQRERKAEAVVQYDKGHVVNPLGKPNTKGRKLMPERTKSIGEVGAVTIAQLWAAYLDLFKANFGDQEILVGQLSGTRENVSRYFDDMRQRFQDSAGFPADNRILYDYLRWFHEPSRLQGLMKGCKYSGSVGYIHPNQVLGKVHIRRYYDQVLVHKRQITAASESIAKYQHLSNFVREAFDEIRGAWGDPVKMTYCLRDYGYVIVGEFMHDAHGFGESEAKKSIINTMASFVAEAIDKDKAMDYLRKVWGATEALSEIESSIWPDWKATCKDFVELAKQQAEKLQGDQDVRRGSGSDNTRDGDVEGRQGIGAPD